jgi:hypothetical protein
MGEQKRLDAKMLQAGLLRFNGNFWGVTNWARLTEFDDEKYRIERELHY